MHKLCLKQKALSTKGDFGMKSWRVARLFFNSKGDCRLRTGVIVDYFVGQTPPRIMRRICRALN